MNRLRRDQRGSYVPVTDGVIVLAYLAAIAFLVMLPLRSAWHHMTEPPERGPEASAALQGALQSLGGSPDRIDSIELLAATRAASTPSTPKP